MSENKDMKTALSEVLAEEMRKNKDICLVGADLMGANGTWSLHQEFGDRVVNVGIAEANMVGVAAGLAESGKTVVCDSFASFTSRRDFDQVFISCAYAGLPVKLIGSDPGVSAEMNGGTHMAFEDIALMRTVPTMTVWEPCDAVSLKKLLPAFLAAPNPVYLRLYRRAAEPVYAESANLTFGKANILRDGVDATVIACGALMVANALAAAKALAQEGISLRVVDMHTVKPIDKAAVIAAAKDTGRIVTVENANYINGLGSAVAEVIAEARIGIPFVRVGVKDEFGEVGKVDYLMKRFHIATEDIIKSVKATFE